MYCTYNNHIYIYIVTYIEWFHTWKALWHLSPSFGATLPVEWASRVRAGDPRCSRPPPRREAMWHPPPRRRERHTSPESYTWVAKGWFIDVIWNWSNPFSLLLNVPQILKARVHLKFPKFWKWPIWLLLIPFKQQMRITTTFCGFAPKK